MVTEPQYGESAQGNDSKQSQTGSTQDIGEPGQAVAQEEAQQTDDRNPANSSQQVREEESAPLHVQGAGEDAVQHAESCDEAREEDGECTVLANEIFTPLNGLRLDVEDATVAVNQGTSAETADQISGIVAGGCRDDGDEDDPADVKVGMAGCERTCDEEDRFAREGRAGALQKQADEDDPVAVVIE